MLNSAKLAPLSTGGLKIPVLEMPKVFSPKLLRGNSPSSPKKMNTPRLTPIDIFEEKLSKLGKVEHISKKELVDNFDTKYYSFMFWTCVHTRTLGTFLVVKTPDSKMHFISMRHKLVGCNFQYECAKKCIYTRDCDSCESKTVEEPLFYEFPEEVIVLTPENPYEVPNILSRM